MWEWESGPKSEWRPCEWTSCKENRRCFFGFFLEDAVDDLDCGCRELRELDKGPRPSSWISCSERWMREIDLLLLDVVVVVVFGVGPDVVAEEVSAFWLSL